jgi:hypothetical protein
MLNLTVIKINIQTVPDLMMIQLMSFQLSDGGEVVDIQ